MQKGGPHVPVLCESHRSLAKKSGKTPLSWTNEVRWLTQPDAKEKKRNAIPVPSTSIHLQTSPRREVGSGFERVGMTPVLRMALIDEPLRAPTCNSSNTIATDEVVGLIEAALTSRRLRRYDAARTLLLQAHQFWTKIAVGTEVDKNEAADAKSYSGAGSSWDSVLKYFDTGDLAQDVLPSEVGLFFLCEFASLSSATGEDGVAMQLLWRARHYSDRLPSSHPDTAVVWGGMGRIAFRIGYFEVAARAAYRARCIREATVGEDTVEAATAYNNVACCLAALKRPLEASAYLELAAELLRILAGEEHPRTQTVLRNLHQARVMRKNVQMPPPVLFSYRVRAKKERRSKSKRRRWSARFEHRSRSSSPNGSRSASRESHRSQGSRGRFSQSTSASRRGSRRPTSASSTGSRRTQTPSKSTNGSYADPPPPGNHNQSRRAISTKLRALSIITRGSSRQTGPL